MTISFTSSTTETFSLSSARYVASKVATDLRQLQRYYGSPSDQKIGEYAEEIALLMHHRCVEKVIYGFQRDGRWILTLEYTVVNGTLTADDRAGRVFRQADVSKAVFASFLTWSSLWLQMDETEREKINKSLPFTRTPAEVPGYAGGYHTFDRTYSANGTGIARSCYRPL